MPFASAWHEIYAGELQFFLPVAITFPIRWAINTGGKAHRHLSHDPSMLSVFPKPERCSCPTVFSQYLLNSTDRQKMPQYGIP